MLKVLRHFLVLPVSFLALAETGVFFGVLLAMMSVGSQTFLAGNAPEVLTWAIAFYLTGLTFLCLAAAGLYNRDVFVDVRLFFQRAGVALLLTIFVALVLFPFYTVFDAVTVEWYLGLLSFTLVAHYPIIIVLRFGLVVFTGIEMFKRRIVIVGDGALADRIRRFANGTGSNHLLVTGYIHRNNFENILGHDNAEVPADFPAGNSPLLKYALDAKADEIIVASKERRGLPIWQLLECRMAGVVVNDYLTFWEREAGQIDLDEVKPSWLALSDGFKDDIVRKFVKRTFDLVVSSIFLIISLPMLILTALAIKLDSRGPIFYLQERAGRHGQSFNMIKFRSMLADAEKDGVPQWAGRYDSRVTRVGALIRRTRIDEFPQILNVLKGEMSFVGPRPERPFFIQHLSQDVPLYAARQNVKPGITGWAQVSYPYGASTEDAKAKLAYDLYYIKNESLFLDLIILLQTVRVVIMLVGSR